MRSARESRRVAQPPSRPQALLGEIESRGLVAASEAAMLAFPPSASARKAPAALLRDAALVLAHCGGERGEAAAREAAGIAEHLRPGSFVRWAPRTPYPSPAPLCMSPPPCAAALSISFLPSP